MLENLEILYPQSHTSIVNNEEIPMYVVLTITLISDESKDNLHHS